MGRRFFLKNLKHILITRTDRLGDLMLALPAVHALRENFPHAQIDFACQTHYHDLIGDFCRERQITLVESTRILAWKSYDAAVFLCENRVLAWDCFRKRVPIRVGILSKVWSFFTWNCPVRQRRSEGKKSEALYNLDLVNALVKEVGGALKTVSLAPVELPIRQGVRERVAHVLENLSLAEKQFVIFHPGSGGSALALSPEKVVKMAAELKALSRFPVLVTEGPSVFDKDKVGAIDRADLGLPILRGLTLVELMEVYRASAAVVAPATGPLHLAHFVGAETVGLFAPVRSQRARRWGPFGGKGHSIALSPTVDCPATRHCLGERCPHFVCMEKQPWLEKMAAMVTWIQPEGRKVHG